MLQLFNRVHKNTYISVNIEFEPRDMWIGIYWNKKHGVTDVYICIVPCLPIHIYIDRYIHN